MAHYELSDLESIYSKTGKLLYKRPTENLERKHEKNKCENCMFEQELKKDEGWMKWICRCNGLPINSYFHDTKKPFWCPLNN